MHSRYRHTIINHNFRYLDWPHAKFDDPNDYWAQLGWHTVGGPMLLNASAVDTVMPRRLTCGLPSSSARA